MDGVQGVDRVWPGGISRDAKVTRSVFLPSAFGSRSYAPPRRARVSPSYPSFVPPTHRDLLPTRVHFSQRPVALRP